MISPDEVRGREFTLALRGYDQQEVRAFLDEVAARLEQAPVASAPTAEHEHSFADLGRTTARILEAAEEAGQAMIAAAEERVAEIEQEARRDAEQQVAERLAEADAVREEAAREREEVRGHIQEARRLHEEAAAALRENERQRQEAAQTIHRAGRYAYGLLEEATEHRRALLTEVDACRERLEHAFAQARRAAGEQPSRTEEAVEQLQSELTEAIGGAHPTGDESAATTTEELEAATRDLATMAQELEAAAAPESADEDPTPSGDAPEDADEDAAAIDHDWSPWLDADYRPSPATSAPTSEPAPEGDDRGDGGSAAAAG